MSASGNGVVCPAVQARVRVRLSCEAAAGPVFGTVIAGPGSDGRCAVRLDDGRARWVRPDQLVALTGGREAGRG